MYLPSWGSSDDQVKELSEAKIRNQLSTEGFRHPTGCQGCSTELGTGISEVTFIFIQKVG